MKKILFGFISYFNISGLMAQIEQESIILRPTNNIYLNLLGDASIFSLNYE